MCGPMACREMRQIAARRVELSMLSTEQLVNVAMEQGIERNKALASALEGRQVLVTLLVDSDPCLATDTSSKTAHPQSGDDAVEAVSEAELARSSHAAASGALSDVIYRRSARWAALPGLSSCVISLACVGWIASVTRNFDSSTTISWLQAAVGALVFQFLVFDPLVSNSLLMFLHMHNCLADKHTCAFADIMVVNN